MYSWFINQLINFISGIALGIGVVLFVLSPLWYSKLINYDLIDKYQFPLTPIQLSFYIVLGCGILSLFLGKNFIVELKNALLEAISMCL